jgi:hypothetical protein
LFHFPATSERWSALLFVPVRLHDNSGVAHVLEHMVGTVQTAEGSSVRGLLSAGMRVGASTEEDAISFFVECGSASEFRHALKTLHRAAFSAALTESLFRQEGFHVAVDQHGIARFAGVVHNEMATDFHAIDRQLDRAVLQALRGSERLPEDPGGDPAAIRRLRHSDCLRFAAQHLSPHRAMLLMRTPEAASQLSSSFDGLPVHRPLPSHDPTLRAVGPRRPAGYALQGHGMYRRLLRPTVPVGPPWMACTQARSWLAECAFAALEGTFGPLADKLDLSFEPHLGGWVRSVDVLAVGATFCARNDRPAEALSRTFASVLAHVARELPADVVEGHVGRRLAQTLAWSEREADDHRFLHHRARQLLDDDLHGTGHFPRQLQEAAHALSTATGLAAAKEAFARAPVTCVSVTPWPLTLEAERHREARMLERLQRRTGLRSATVMQVPPPPGLARPHTPGAQTKGSTARLATGGRSHWHQLLNVSQVSLDDLIALPLLLQRLQRALQRQGIDLQVNLFSHALTSTASLQLVSLRLTGAPAQLKADVDAVHRGLDELAGCEPMDRQSVALAWQAAAQATDSLVMAQAADRACVSAEVIRTWQGVPQLHWLRQMSGTDPIGGRPMSRAAAGLLACPAAVFTLQDGDRPLEVVEGMAERVGATAWPRRDATALASDRPGALLVLGSKPECSVARRQAISITDAATAAGVLALRHSWMEQYLEPRLRDDLGAYGAFFDFDVASMEMCWLIYRTGSPATALTRLRPSASVADVLAGERPAYPAATQRARARLEWRSDPLTMTLGQCYDLATGCLPRKQAIAQALEALSWEQAIRLVDEAFSQAGGTDVVHCSMDDPPGMRPAMPSTSVV